MLQMCETTSVFPCLYNVKWICNTLSVCMLVMTFCAELHPEQEIEYINEGKNADRFRRNFRGLDWVEAPAVHWFATSSRVITLSYLPGIKVHFYRNLSQHAGDALRRHLLLQRRPLLPAQHQNGDVWCTSQYYCILAPAGWHGTICGATDELRASVMTRRLAPV